MERLVGSSEVGTEIKAPRAEDSGCKWVDSSTVGVDPSTIGGDGGGGSIITSSTGRVRLVEVLAAPAIALPYGWHTLLQQIFLKTQPYL